MLGRVVASTNALGNAVESLSALGTQALAGRGNASRGGQRLEAGQHIVETARFLMLDAVAAVAKVVANLPLEAVARADEVR
ncbi:MAG: hypothetical protein J07HN6_00950 [Halonotius sp. J07HN6]|nr:MAG: hypothetical protein J07HN6_00950 [Halonotius sp. J07HN6]